MTDQNHKRNYIAALLIVYIVWGSTYLGIKFVNMTMPPMLSAGVRFLIAGLVLYGWKRFRGEKEQPKHWRPSIIAGGLFFMIANGVVVLGLQYVDSGIASLIIALTPILIVLYDQVLKKKITVGALTFIGLFVGLIGQIILFNPADVFAGDSIHLGGALLILFSPIAWAAGTVYVQRADIPNSRGLAASMQMISGGVLLLFAGSIRGEWELIQIDKFSTLSLLSFIYLIFFGSIVTFTAYNWLMKNTSASILSTVGYVNPIIALALGVLFGGEILDYRSIIAAVIILLGVFLITWDKNRRAKADLVAADTKYAS